MRKLRIRTPPRCWRCGGAFEPTSVSQAYCSACAGRDRLTTGEEQGRVAALPAHGTALPDRQIEEDAPAAEQDNDEPAVYVMGADETTEGATEPEPAGEASPEATGEGQGEPNLPAPATEGGGDLRARAQRAHDILLEHFPDAKAMVSFGLYEGYGARTLDEVKDDQLEKLIVEMREIYRNEKAEREGMRA